MLQDFVSEMRAGVVATLNADGTPQQTPAGIYYDGEFFYFSTGPDSAELHNLQRDPRLSLCTAEPDDRGTHMTIHGSVVEWRGRRAQGRIFARVAPQGS